MWVVLNSSRQTVRSGMRAERYTAILHQKLTVFAIVPIYH
jgi:hypothetical protein